MAYNLNRLISELSRVRAWRGFILMRDLFSAPARSFNPAVLRLDVERALAHHVKLAEQLSHMGIACTMYFHTRRNAYCTKTLQAIQSLGHEVGYHHECLDRCRGDFPQARDLFLREVALFRKDGIDLRTVCSHGEAGLPRLGYRANWDLFVRYPELLEEAGVLGEVYMWLKQHNPHYASDTFRSYRRFWSVLISASTDTPLIILVHPHRWRRHLPVSAVEVTRDLWQQLQNRIRGARTYDLAY